MKKLVVMCMVVMLLALGVFAPSAQAWDNGTPYPGPSAPQISSGTLTIQAENFNGGTNRNAFFAGTPGNNGNNTTYRTDSIDVDISGTGPIYVQNSYLANGEWYDKEWLKFTFTCPSAEAGWYQISYRVNGGYDIRTLMNEREVARVGGTAASWTTVVGAERVYITGGSGAGKEHVLKVDLSNGTQFDYVTLTRVYPTPPSPAIVTPTLATDDMVVADVVISAPHTNIGTTIPTTDAQPAIQGYLDDLAKYGGGLAWLPAGLYRIRNTIYIPNNVTLRGDWASPYAGGNSAGTILVVGSDMGAGYETGPIAVDAANFGYVEGLSIWYDNQNSASPVAYPYSIRGYFVQNITLYNTWQGVWKWDTGFSYSVKNIYGCFLKMGVYVYSTQPNEYAGVLNVKMDTGIWAAVTTPLNNGNQPPAGAAALKSYVGDNATALRYYYYRDGAFCYGIDAPEAQYAGTFGDSPGYDFFGFWAKLNGDIDVPDNQIMDLVPEIASYSYVFQSRKQPTAANFRNAITDFGAAGDGVTDDSAAIQNAINAVYSLGGGIVYLPQGQYRITTPITVKANVELRGPTGSIRAFPGEQFDVCTIYADIPTSAAPDTDPALITLEAGAGIRGFDIVYKNQGFGAARAPVVANPYAVRIPSTATNSWVIDVSMLNAYYGVDVSGNGHYIRGLYGVTWNQGLNIHDTTSGNLEEIVLNDGYYGPNHRTTGPTNDSEGNWGGAYLVYLYTNSHPFRFTNCSGEKGLGVNMCLSENTFHLENFTNSEIWMPGADLFAYTAAYKLYGDCNGLKIFGLWSSSTGPPHVCACTNFSGTVDIYDYYLIGSSIKVENYGTGTINFHNEFGEADSPSRLTGSSHPQTCDIVVDNGYAGKYSASGGFGTTIGQGFKSDIATCAAQSGGMESATWYPNVPRDMDYKVYITWTPGGDRAINAPFTVTHLGGSANFAIDQTQSPYQGGNDLANYRGAAWRYLGTWDFSSSTGAITLSNNTAEPGKVVIADAVLFRPNLYPSGGPGPDITVTFVNIANDGDPINGWQDNPSPDGIDFDTGNLWLGWDSASYGLPGPGKCALMNDNSYNVVRTIYLPAGKVLKKVDLGKCQSAALGTITFSSSGNPDRVVQISSLPLTNYALNWTNASPSVTITVDITNSYCVGSVIGFDNFVFGDAGTPPPPDVTVTFINIANNGDPINGWHDNPSPDGIDFGTNLLWTGWDSVDYGLSGPGKLAEIAVCDTYAQRTISLPANKVLKKVDLGKIDGATGTITFSAPGSGNPDRDVPLSSCPQTGYQLNWSNPSPSVTITITVTDGTCKVSGVGFDNFVFGDAGTPPPPDVTVTFVNIQNNGDPINGWHDNPSPDGIDFGTNLLWTGWDSVDYGLSGPGKLAEIAVCDTYAQRTISLPANKVLKKVDLGKIDGATGTITFSAPGSGNPDRDVPLSSCPQTGYQLNWSNPSPSVTITITVTDGTCKVSGVGFDNFVFGE